MLTYRPNNSVQLESSDYDKENLIFAYLESEVIRLSSEKKLIVKQHNGIDGRKLDT
jgi:hypothetical protein